MSYPKRQIKSGLNQQTENKNNDKSSDIYFEIIFPDENFWKEKMKEQ
jgi:hypothetical protein